MSLKTTLQQFYPSYPSFTDKNVPAVSLAGKVFIITGATSGIGVELVKRLYPSGATIYLAGRSRSKLVGAIAEIESSASTTQQPAKLRYLCFDLDDLRTIKPAVDEFASQQSELHVLWNNAGQGFPPGSSTKQGLEASVGTNCVAPLLLTQLLLPQLQNAARKSTQSDTVRIVWTGSAQIDMKSPPGGVDFARIDAGRTVAEIEDYAISKAGNLMLAHEAAKRWGKDGIINVCINPGNLKTAIFDGQAWWLRMLLNLFVLYEPRYGAYTMLFAGLSSEVTEANNGAYIWPWGIVRPNPRADVYQAIADGSGKRFWEWCENKAQQYQ
jgi:NAD(P)-dependent dehydrogenase (short-subunit alcohol dehydrogenase family)